MLSTIAQLHDQAALAIRAAVTLPDIEAIRRDFLGKSGSLPRLRRRLGEFDLDERKRLGAALNDVISELTSTLDARESGLLDAEPALPSQLDVTIPGLPAGQGGLHPSIQLMYDLNDAFAALNFDVYSGPEVSSELFEFDNMNFPADHPARESMDTFWLTGTADSRGAERLALRPHLTGASVRYMLEHEPPLRFVYPGRVYRNETTDSVHERSFFQYEVLIVAEHVPLTAGKFLVDTILDTVFGKTVRTRMRTGFFPFVEPGFEIDMECQVCAGAGCRTCGRTGWIELMPGGAPHPNVLRAGGLDPDRWTGFYVNVGLDRLTMMRYGIDDVRMMHSADLRYLSQFA